MFSSPFKAENPSSPIPSTNILSLTSSFQFKMSENTNSPVIGAMTSQNGYPHMPSNGILTSPLFENKWHTSMLSPVLITPFLLKSTNRHKMENHTDNNQISSFDDYIPEEESKKEENMVNEIEILDEGVSLEKMDDAMDCKELKKSEVEVVNEQASNENHSSAKKRQFLSKKEWAFFKMNQKKTPKIFYDFKNLLKGLDCEFYSDSDNDELLLSEGEEMKCVGSEIQQIEKPKFYRETLRNVETVNLKIFLNENFGGKRNHRKNLLRKTEKHDSDFITDNEDDFEKPQVLKKTITKSPKDSVFECEVCGAIFDKGNSLGGHMSKWHPEQSWKMSVRKETRNKRAIDRVRSKVLKEECLQQLQSN